MSKSRVPLSLLFSFVIVSVTQADSIRSLQVDTSAGLGVRGYITVAGVTVELEKMRPLFSLEINDRIYNSQPASVSKDQNGMRIQFPHNISAKLIIEHGFSPGWKAKLVFENHSARDTVKIANVVPFGQSNDHTYIASSPPWNLASSKLYRPGVGPLAPRRGLGGRRAPH